MRLLYVLCSCIKVDQAAGSALKDAGADVSQPGYVPPPVTSYSATQSGTNTSGNVSSGLNEKRASSGHLSQMSRPSQPSPQHTAPAAALLSNNGAKSLTSQQKRDKDEELFEFLNSPDNGADGSMMRKSSQSNLKTIGSGKHSRQSSVSSTVSNRSSKVGGDQRTSGVISLNTDSSSSGKQGFTSH